MAPGLSWTHRRPWSTRLRHSTERHRVVRPRPPGCRPPLAPHAVHPIAGSSKTISPPMVVSTTFASPIGPASGANRSRSITARSASLPVSIEPVTSSRWLTHADPSVNPWIASASVEPLGRQERLLLAARLGPDPFDRHLHLEQRVRGGDAPVGAHRQPCPGAQQRGERVLPRRPLRPEEGDRQLVHLGLVARPEGLGVAGHAQRARSAGCRPGGSPGCGRCGGRVSDRAVRRPGRVEGVQRLADRPVADRVEVGLEPGRVEPDDGLVAAPPGR